MGVRMGICANNPEEYPRCECQMSYDFKLVNSLEYVNRTCLGCDSYKVEGIDYCSCFSSFIDTDGYYILPKSTLLDNTSVTNYEAMLKLFEEENVDTIYIILF